MESYYYKDINKIWIKVIFETNSFAWSNKDIAEWIDTNYEKYEEKHFYEIEEFHNYSYYDSEINEYFCEKNFFIEKLVKYDDLVNFLNKKDLSKAHPI